MKAFPRHVLVALCVLLLSFAAFGQAISGDLVGTVVDKSGAVVANASVAAVNQATNVKTVTTTGASGDYRFANLPVGTYNVSASGSGFNTMTLKGIPVELNKTANARFTLQVGTVSETVEVTSAAPAVDTTTAQLQTTYEIKEAQDLPTAGIGLGVLNLSLLQAGVGSSGGIGAGTGPSVGGQRPRNNNFTVEGVDNNDKGVTGPLIYIPNDAVQNFTVLQNQFSPEFGHSTGGQFNTVVTSGTNTFHGRAYEYFQNRNLNAIDYSVANQGLKKNPRYDNNRFGGQIGGPVIKDKLFFFANYEYQPIGQAAVPGSPVLAPTAAGYTTLAGIAGLSATNLGILKQYAIAPSACNGETACPKTNAKTGQQANNILVNGTNVPVGIFPIAAPNYQNFKALTTSMDWNISGSDQLRGRYIYNKSVTIDTAATLPVFYTTVPQPYHLVNLSEYHTFGPHVNNEFRVGFNRTGNNFGVGSQTYPGLDAFPNIALEDLGGLNIGPDGNAPQFAVQNFYQAVDNVGWVKGNHDFKFGVEGRKYIAPQKFIQRARGDYDYNTTDLFLRDQTPDVLAERSFGSVGYSGDQIAFYWFVNDTWRVLPNLSLNLGVRHEYTTVPYGERQQNLNSLASVPGLITFDSPQAPKNDFMPRIGFAYSPGGSQNTSIRGGFSMGYDVLYDNIGTLSRPPQIGSTVDCPKGAGCPATGAGFLGAGGIKPTGQTGITTLSVAKARANTSAFLPVNEQLPYSESWTLGVQHSFLTNYSAEVRYVGTRGIHLNVQDRINVTNLVTPTNFLPTYTAAPTQAQLDALTNTLASISAPSNILPAYAAAGFTTPIVGFEPYGGSNYEGLATQVTRRMTKGLQFQVAWTWSHTIDDSTADFFSTVLTPRRPQDFQNLHPDRANSALDRAHRVTMFAIYDVPWFKNSNWFARNILGNYEIAPTYTYETGEWGDVQSATDTNLNGDSAGDRAIFNPTGVPGTSTDVTALKNTGGATVAYLANTPNAQYIRAQAGALANSGRNTLQLNPINNWDLSLVKRIAVTERYKVEFAAGFFNAFNHPQFVAGSLNQINSIGRTTGAVKNYLTPGKSNFNVANVTFPSNARTAQLALKFIF
jgi:hypothetical protein